MKKQRTWVAASTAGVALALLAAACGGSTYHTSNNGAGKTRPSTVFTYDTYTQVMVDGWDPATEYSNGIIAMSNMYETLTRYNPVTNGCRSFARDQLVAFVRRPDLDLPAPARRALPHRAADDRAGSQGRHPAHQKLNGGAAYIWGAVKSIDTPSQYTMVFHLSYPSPLALEASADYSAYIYDTQAAGNGSLTKWLNTPHDAGTGPYTLQSWNNGQEFEVVLKAFRRVLGRLEGQALHEGRVPRGPAGHHGRAAAAFRAGQLRRADEPDAVEVAAGRARASSW